MVIISPISSDEDEFVCLPSPTSSDEDEVVCPPNLGSLPSVFNLKDGLETARKKGIKHFKHEHGLEFKECVHNVRCMGCGHKMEGRGFSCMKHCNFHLHEICALFPEEIPNYPEHDAQHLLKLEDSAGNICDICGRHLEREFSYNCSICHFDVDIRCASMHLSFCSSHHKHELTSKLYLVSSLCYLCGEKHGELGMFYECRSCSFLIHEKCYYLSDTTQYRSHWHPLNIGKHDSRIYSFSCAVCKEDMVTNYFMVYNCDKCHFYWIHLKCFHRDQKVIDIPLGEEGEIVCSPNLGSFLAAFNLKDGLEKARDKGIKHFQHEHGLEFKEYVRDVLCEGCGNEMGGRGFSCMRHCNFHLHEICALFPAELRNYPHHPQHHLTIKIHQDDRPFTSCVNCNGCKNLITMGSYYYSCDSCDSCPFRVHLRCVAMCFPLHGGHHEHELTANLHPASFLCSFCGEKHGELGMSYKCKTCPFWIHEQCYYLPDNIRHHCHRHSLHISIYDPSKMFNITSIEVACGVCEEIIPKFVHTYKCDRCNYFIHLKCLHKKRNRKALKISPGHDELIQFPRPSARSVQNILTHFIKQKCGWEDIEDKEEAPMLLHHPSHDHPLALIDGPIENGPDVEIDLPEFDSFNICDILVNQSCNACTLLVLDASFYRCIESCNFVLHKWCAKLPREIQHPAHYRAGHTLVLQQGNVKFADFFFCSGCTGQGNGFVYKCTKCEKYYLDVICACLPSFVKHDYDKHPLILETKYRSNSSCNSCAGSLYGFSFNCDVCHFRLDLGCLLLPKEIRHRYDNHGFKLTDSAPTCKEYYCELCEQKLDPNRWIYHCLECDNSADINCVMGRVFNLFRRPLKFGLSYSPSSSTTPWTCIPIFRKENNHCYRCKYDLFSGSGRGFFCRQSKTILCYSCFKESTSILQHNNP